MIINIEFVFPNDRFYTKSGSIRKFDLDNMLKLLLDAIFELLGAQYGVDDCQITEIQASKRVGAEMAIKINISKEIKL